MTMAPAMTNCLAQTACGRSPFTSRRFQPCKSSRQQPGRIRVVNHAQEAAATTQQQAAAAALAVRPQLQQSCLLSLAALLATAGAAHAVPGAQPLLSLSELDAAAAHSAESVLRPLFTVFTFLYIIRIPMTWYPSIDGTKFPWVLAYAPTEPVLKATRNVIPLVGGVDVTPIVWVGLISFFNEILLGPQGILMLIQRESGSGLL